MNEHKINYIKYQLYSILTLILILSPKAWCEIPDLIFIYSTSENVINVDNQECDETMQLSSGGDSIRTPLSGSNENSTLWVSFGQPFAGRAYSTHALTDLIDEGHQLYNSGAAFLQNTNIMKMALVEDQNTLDNQYNEDQLFNAEIAYRRALYINPLNDKAVIGIIKARLAKVLKNNLVWDIQRREQLRLRLTDSSVNPGSTILEKEIDLLQIMSANQKNSIAFLLELLSDPQPGGAGDLLRGERTISQTGDSDVVFETFMLLFSTGRRFAETQIAMSQKKVLLHFFDEKKRTEALSNLYQAHAYITELMRLLNPYCNESMYGTTDLLQLTSLQSKLNEISSLIEQGYNAFGFLPDFVPFKSGSSSNDNNLNTFNMLHEIANDSISLAKLKEKHAKDNETQFAHNSADYLERLESLHASYYQRLKSIVGVVENQNGEDIPDIYTFLIPDKDIDNDGILERDNARQRLLNESGFVQFKSKGQIAQQYAMIDEAGIRVEQAFNELENIVKEIEIREQTAQKVFDIQEDIAKLIKKNGEEISLLIRQKGRLQKEAAKKGARIEKNSNLLSVYLGAGSSAINTFLMNSNASKKDRNPKWVLEALAFGTSIANGIQKANSKSKISRIQGQLAEDLANIDAKINEIRTIQEAEIVVKSGQQQLLRTEQELKVLALRQANLALNLSIAQKDYDRELAVLSNMIDEVGTLIADLDRAENLAEKNFQNNAIGWQENDVRDVLTNSVLIADKAFYRAQIWSFIALRALEYYANLPPDFNGQPNLKIKNLYQTLYQARCAEDLKILLSTMKNLADTDFLFTRKVVECPQKSHLSLKYDILIPAMLQVQEGDDNEDDKDNKNYWVNSDTGEILTGEKAYIAIFRNVLRNGLQGTKPKRVLKLVFSTDLYPRTYDGDKSIRENPFYSASAIKSKIIGFTNPNCLGVSIENNIQGIQVNITGTLKGLQSTPYVRLAQVGNSYIKHSQWKAEDFDNHGRLINPLNAITVYSAYKQIFPSWLITDISSENTVEDTISSSVSTLFYVLKNSDGVSGKTLAFTDRSVANDRWELSFSEIENSANKIFLDKIEDMLNSPLPESNVSEFLKDIQLWIGWAYQNPSSRKKTTDDKSQAILQQ